MASGGSAVTGPEMSLGSPDVCSVSGWDCGRGAGTDSRLISGGNMDSLPDGRTVAPGSSVKLRPTTCSRTMSSGAAGSADGDGGPNFGGVPGAGNGDADWPVGRAPAGGFGPWTGFGCGAVVVVVGAGVPFSTDGGVVVVVGAGVLVVGVGVFVGRVLLGDGGGGVDVRVGRVVGDGGGS